MERGSDDDNTLDLVLVHASLTMEHAQAYFDTAVVEEEQPAPTPMSAFRVNDEAYMSTMGVGSNNSHWSQTNDMHFDDHEFKVDEDGEGIVDAPKSRGGNYTNDEDILLCNTWLQVSRDPSVGEASSDDGKRIPTPNSVSCSKPKRPDGCKNDAKEKKKRKGDDELKNAMESIVKARKEANEVRKMARNQDAAAEERRLAAEDRRVAVEERKVTLEERKVGMEEQSRLLEWEKYLFFLDTSTLNEAQKKYVNLTREEVLIQKRAMIRGMGGGGIGGMGAMGGFGATMAAWVPWVALELPWRPCEA
ncbi:Alternative oxidase 1a, mitochondrial [Hordeum vulgare]|nr:Alternative oxidase 1a, mitochondrial [Hordeum vulgare]